MRRLVALALVVALAAPTAASLADANDWRSAPRNVAHRGGALEAPENTLFAFHEAVQAGADVLELDVQRARDGSLVVLHDPTVDRTTDGHGPAAAYNASQLQRLDAAYWFVPGQGADPDADPDDYVYRGIATGEKAPPAGYSPQDFTIPTLDEVLARFPDTLLYVEVKSETPDAFAVADQVADAVHAHGRVDDVVVSSAHDGVIEAMQARHPEIDTARGWARTATFWFGAHAGDGTPRTGHEILSAPHELGGRTVVDRAFVDDAHARGLAAYAWTVNDEQAMQRLVDLGVDGVITDRPSVLEGVLGG